MASRYAKLFNSVVIKVSTSVATIIAVAAICCSSANAQIVGGGGFANSAVGGIKIDAESLLSVKESVVDANVLARLKESLAAGNQDVNEKTEMRMISLKALNKQIEKAAEQKQPIPVEVRFMAGIQRIKYLIVDEANSDIIVGGPAEGLVTDAIGSVVGAKSGLPAIHLEDFLIALRTASAARTGKGVSVSMDPTPEGVQNLRKLYAGKNQFSPQLVDAIQKAMGEHVISLTGVPKDTRFAQILVAADYRMKRLAMGLDQSKARNMPSIIHMSAKARTKMRGAPRMWMECSYNTLATDEKKNVWELRGVGVRALTENAFFNRDGVAEVAGKENKFATAWAERLSERYDEISKSEPVFGELRNLMDMSVVAAVIEREGLVKKSGVDIEMLLDDDISFESREIPESLPTQCSFVNVASKGYIVTASGGVQVDSWGVAEKSEVVEGMGKVGELAVASHGDRWWWNAK